VLNHLRNVEKEMDVVDSWCEMELRPTRDFAQLQLLRAHPNVDKFGCYFDWVDAKFDVVGDSDDDSSCEDIMHVAPTKLLAFSRDTNGEECAIVLSVEWSDGKETAFGNTHLILNYFIEFQASGWPAIRKFKLENLYRPLYIIERKRCEHPLPPRTTARHHQKEHVVFVVKSRTAWAKMFYWWRKDEVEPWPDEVAAVLDSSDFMSIDDDSSQEV
jgi:hypothetical protein